MPRQRNPNTIHERTLAFLRDAHRAIQDDATDARLSYLAMHHRLSTSILSAIQQAGIVRKGGWAWYWTAGKPTKATADTIRDIQLAIQRRSYTNLKYARR